MQCVVRFDRTFVTSALPSCTHALRQLGEPVVHRPLLLWWSQRRRVTLAQALRWQPVTCRTQRRGGRLSRSVSLRKGNRDARWRHIAKSWIHTAHYHVFTHLCKTLSAHRCVRWVDRMRQEASSLLLCVDNLGNFGLTVPRHSLVLVLAAPSTTLMYQEYDTLSLVVLGTAMSTARSIASRFVKQYCEMF